MMTLFGFLKIQQRNKKRLVLWLRLKEFRFKILFCQFFGFSIFKIFIFKNAIERYFPSFKKF